MAESEGIREPWYSGNKSPLDISVVVRPAMAPNSAAYSEMFNTLFVDSIETALKIVDRLNKKKVVDAGTRT